MLVQIHAKLLLANRLDDVDATVALATLLHNTSYHEALKMTPYEALFGRVPHIVRCQAYYNPTTEDHRRTLRDTLAYSRLQKHYLATKQIDPVAPTADIEVGDIVFRRDPGGVADSLKETDSITWMEAVWSLPMKLIQVDNTQITLQDSLTGKLPFRVHKDKIRKFA